jgi:transposase
MDMARNMGLAVKNSFPNTSMVIDRFHVVRLVIDAMQHMRVSLRWEAIKQENIAVALCKEAKERYVPETLSNGDTLRELLARSRYLLYKTESDWSINQAKRATLLFNRYPLLKKAYHLTLQFRAIYEGKCKVKALTQFKEWKNKVETANIEHFNTAVNSLEYHLDNILNFLNNRNTNANAESFNSKIKNFRSNLRGVTDIDFFLFRLEKLFA